jgi:hypothetical protein
MSAMDTPDRDGLQTFRDREAPRQNEFSVGEVPQLRAQIKARQHGDGYRRVGVAVRADRQEGNPNAVCRAVVQLGALDGDPGPSSIEHDGLVVSCGAVTVLSRRAVASSAAVGQDQILIASVKC